MITGNLFNDKFFYFKEFFILDQQKELKSRQYVNQHSEID